MVMNTFLKLPSVALATEIQVGFPNNDLQPIKETLMKGILCLSGSAVVCMTCYGTFRGLRYVYNDPTVIGNWTRRLLGDRIYSMAVQKCSSSLSPDRRRLFRDLTIDHRMVGTGQPTHSHPEAAQMRGMANAMMDNFANMIGRRLYSVSCSRSEQDHTDGNRMFYFAKDLQQDFKEDHLSEENIIKMTDVDYYVDMPKYLRGNDVMLYTFVPQAVAGATHNGSYRILPNNHVETHVNGGANYSHPVWDYETDHIIVDHWWGSSFYLVEQKILSDDRRLIYLNFIRTVYGPLGWVLPGFRVKHRQMVFGEMAYVKYMEGGKDPVVKHSFAALKDYTTAVVDDKTLVTIRARIMHATKPTMSDIERVLRSQDVPQADVISGILYLAMMDPSLSKLILSNPNYPITKFENGDNVYMPVGTNVLEDGKPMMRKITEPFMLDAAHPSRSHNSDQACLTGRVHNVKNPVKKVPPFYYQCLKEFAEMAVPDHMANTLVPEDFDFIHQAWKRPTQRSFLERAKHLFYFNRPCVVKSFQKAEAYAKVTHPRNISTLPTGHNARLGQFVYVFCQHVMKNQHWYAFGKHPTDIADTVYAKASKSQIAIPTDISKLDGSGGPFHTDIEKALLVRAFAEPYKNELHGLIAREANISGFTTYGIHYLAEDNTLSGSSKTSTRNSLITAAVSYIAYRCSGHEPKAAYERLGIYGGDDGINFDIEPAMLVKVFAKTGLVLKADVVTMGSAVPFLGRYFLDPWTCPHSVADVPRQLRKLHLTAAPKVVPRDVVLKRRAEAILITDSETPVLSDWAKAVLRCVKTTAKEEQRYRNLTAGDVSYWSTYANPFPPCPNKELTNAVVSDMFNGNLKVLFLIARLNAATKIEDMTFLVDDTPPKIEVTSVLQGVIHKAPNTVSHQQILKRNQQLVTKTGRGATKIPKGGAKKAANVAKGPKSPSKPKGNNPISTKGATTMAGGAANAQPTTSAPPTAPPKKATNVAKGPKPPSKPKGGNPTATKGTTTIVASAANALPTTSVIPTATPAASTVRAPCKFKAAGQPCPNRQCRFKH